MPSYLNSPRMSLILLVSCILHDKCLCHFLAIYTFTLLTLVYSEELHDLCNSYTMGLPPVREDNPRALASGLSYVQVDKHTTYISVDLAHHEIVRANDGKGDIIYGIIYR